MSDEGIIVPAGGQPMPINTAIVEGGISKETGAEIHGSIEREHSTAKGDLSVGVEGELSQKKGGRIAGFIKWVWGK
jgi:hypothetical protein